MKPKMWLIGWAFIVSGALIITGMFVHRIDPYFHYHKPNTELYYYSIDNQRSQNNGISIHFDYDALITGTSMADNFKTSEMDEIFGVKSIKVSYVGGTYEEINNNLIIALKNNPELKTVVRGLDIGFFFDLPDRMRTDLGVYPTYLYDKNPFNDVKYLFNKDVIFGRAYAMTQERKRKDFVPGITSFDDYSNWQHSFTFGINTVAPDGITAFTPETPVPLSDEERSIIKENITQNVTSLADKYPTVTFYYFFTPYSAIWWKNLVANGTIYKQIEAEKYIIELILAHDNIQLYSLNTRTDITTNINNYKDPAHYGQWINSLLLKCMHNDEYRLTKDNYNDYLNEERVFYASFDYCSLNNQIDYENDFYTAALMNEEIWNVKPINLLSAYKDSLELTGATILENQYNSLPGIFCTGCLQRAPESEISISDYILNDEYIGAKIKTTPIKKHNYLVFYGKKITGQGQPSVYIYDEKNIKIGEITADSQDLNNEWHQYVIDLSKTEGSITIYLNGGSIDNTGNPDSSYIFSSILLY